jgi:diguanylate cyclase (GGDEF)-like protein
MVDTGQPSLPGQPAREPPPLPGIRRLVVVGAAALLMIGLAIAASLVALRNDREVRRQYDDAMAMTRLAFDAQSLATRIRALQELAAPATGSNGGAAPVGGAGVRAGVRADARGGGSAALGAAAAAADHGLRSGVHAVDIDLAEWDRRMTDLRGRTLPAEATSALGRLQPALAAMGATLHASLDSALQVTPDANLHATPKVTPRAAAVRATQDPAEVPGPLPAADGTGGVTDGAATDPDRAYLATVEASQAVLLASVRAGGDRAVAGGYTFGEIAAGAVVASSLLALVLGVALALLLGQAQRENRAALGVMGQLLRTDPLTGIANRRGLDENLPVELARAKRSGSMLSLAMIDLDYFKRYNSRRGHVGGDALLRAAAQAWRKQLRPTDTLVRYGGEEFTLVLPSCDAEQACQLVSRLRPVLPDAQTFSAGIATWDFRESGQALLRRADEALLAAKSQGRNRTVVSGGADQIALDLTSA